MILVQVKNELRRFFTRRVTRLVIALILVIITGVQVAQLVRSNVRTVVDDDYAIVRDDGTRIRYLASAKFLKQLEAEGCILGESDGYKWVDGYRNYCTANASYGDTFDGLGSVPASSDVFIDDGDKLGSSGQANSDAPSNQETGDVRNEGLNQNEREGFDPNNPPDILTGRLGDVVEGYTPFKFAEVKDRRIDIATHLGQDIKAFGFMLVLALVLIASSFVAADFGNDSMGVLLTFEPRRLQLSLAKYLAAFVSGVLISWAVVVYYTAWQYLGSVTRGISPDVSWDWWQVRLGQELRISIVVGGAAAIAAGVGLLAKRTVVAVIAAFILNLATSIIGVFSWGKVIARYSPANIVNILIEGKIPPPNIISVGPDGAGGENIITESATWGLDSYRTAIIVGVIWLVGVCLLATSWFKNRDYSN